MSNSIFRYGQLYAAVPVSVTAHNYTVFTHLCVSHRIPKGSIHLPAITVWVVRGWKATDRGQVPLSTQAFSTPRHNQPTLSGAPCSLAIPRRGLVRRVRRSDMLMMPTVLSSQSA